MVSIHGQVTDKTSEGVWVSFESPARFCEGCHCAALFAPGHRATRENIWLPGGRLPGDGRTDEDIVLSISSADNVQLVAHSIGLPLVGFVAGALVSHLLGASEFLEVLGSLAGMSLGIFYCKELSLNKFKIDRG
ncbi:MAG: SoxR reducing system RseC family protein [Pseudomonadales bacterium]